MSLNCLEKYCGVRYLTDKAIGRETSQKDADAETRRLEAEADFKRSKANMAALQLRELEGTMHRSEDVEAVMMDLVYTIRSMLMALPGRLAVDVFGAGSAAEASDLIRAEVYKILAELALPVAGLLSEKSLKETAQSLKAVRQSMEKLGYVHYNPIMSFATLGLPVSPALKLTDKGLIDVKRGKIVPLILS